MIYDEGRIPVIALEYSKKYLRRKKELMIDYANGKIYVVSADDKDIIFDITEQISTIAKANITADNVTITIEGIGTVNLTDMIKRLYNSEVNFNTEGETDFGPSLKLDGKSITVIDGKIEVNNFSTATDGTVPTKNGSAILWSKPTASASVSLIVNIAESVTENSVTYKKYSVDGDNVYRILEDLVSGSMININTVTGNYSKIVTYFHTGSNSIVLNLNKSVILNSSFPITSIVPTYDNTTGKNSTKVLTLAKSGYYTLTFETFTKGSIWTLQAEYYPDSSANISSGGGGGVSKSIDTFTLAVASWSNGTYTISDSNIKADSLVFIDTPIGSSSANINAISDAKLMCTSQTAGSIVLQALGTVPTIEVTIQLAIL